MVNFQFNLASISGIVLAVGGASLYAVRSFRPQIARDTDIFFSAVGLLCGLILIFYGWRFDPIMQFGQVLLTGAAVYFVFENLRLRQISTEQAKRTTPIVDDDRPVSSQYTAAFEEEPYTVSFPNRESRTSLRDSNRRRPAREDEYDERPPIRERSTRSDEPRLRPASKNTRSRRDESLDEPREDVRSTRRSSSRNNARPRRNNAIEDINQPDDAGYVDYRPIDTNRNDGWGE